VERVLHSKLALQIMDGHLEQLIATLTQKKRNHFSLSLFLSFSLSPFLPFSLSPFLLFSFSLFLSLSQKNVSNFDP
jgi:hypothetical protein